MSILYCCIPDFAPALARRGNPNLRHRPLVLIGPEGRVFAASAEAAVCGIAVGQTARAAEVRCPEAQLLEANVAGCRSEFETLLELLELTSPRVEPHGWGAAYVDLGNLARRHADAVALCKEVGQAVRRELGELLPPALGWDRTKFTAQAATRRTRPGHLRAVATVQERAFLQPLPVSLLPLGKDALQRLGFLGLRTLGQYAALPPGAVWQQFGRAGRLAQRCARGENDRPVVPRWQERRLVAHCDLEDPLAEREHLLAVLRHQVSPLLAELRGNLQACGQMRLTVHFADGSTQEGERTFLFPTADETRVMLALEQLLTQMHWQAGATSLKVTLERIQDVVADQLPLIPGETEREQKLREVQRYLAARFGANRLRRAVLSQPGAPLPEWRVGWLEEP
jgi:nucleotidyltransferase/DNA polymerase involved in DNA repair